MMVVVFGGVFVMKIGLVDGCGNSWFLCNG